jgi:hypothetical protein
MVNISTEYGKPKLGRPFSSGPTDPQKILLIIRLRDEEHYRFRIIGEILGEMGYGAMTTQGTSQLYQKWKKWADTYKKTRAA